MVYRSGLIVTVVAHTTKFSMCGLLIRNYFVALITTVAKFSQGIVINAAINSLFYVERLVTHM